MFLVNHNIPYFATNIPTFTTCPPFTCWLPFLTLNNGANIQGRHRRKPLYTSGVYRGKPHYWIFLFQSTFISNVYSCFLLANNQSCNTHAHALQAQLPSCLCSAVKRWNSECQGRCPRTSPCYPTPPKKWWIQLFSSQECQKHAIPPSKPPPSPPPPVSCYLFIPRDEESFKKTSHSLIKRIEAGRKCRISKFPVVICTTSTTRKTEIKRNFLLNKKYKVLDHTHIKRQLIWEKTNTCFWTMCF